MARAYISRRHGVHRQCTRPTPTHCSELMADELHLQAVAGLADITSIAQGSRSDDPASRSLRRRRRRPARWRRTRRVCGTPRSGTRMPISTALRRFEHLLRIRARTVDGLHLRRLSRRRTDTWAGAGGQVTPGVRQARPAARPATARRRLRLGLDGAVCGPPRSAGARRHAVRGSRPNGASRPSSTKDCSISPRSGTWTTGTYRRPDSTRSPRSG